MSYFRVRKFIPSDLLNLNLQERQASTFTQFSDVNQLITYGYSFITHAAVTTDGKVCCWSALDDSEVIGCGGIIKASSTVGEAWLLLSDNFIKYARRIIPIIKEQISKVNVLRLQAMADTEFKQANRFLKLLGFEYEATLEKSGIGGCDQNVYKIIRGES